MLNNKCKYFDSINGYCGFNTDYSTEVPTYAKCVKLEGLDCSQYDYTNVTTIQHKHEVGDIVWVTYYINDKYYPCKFSSIVNKVIIEKTSDGITVNYRIETKFDGYDSIFETYPEKFCFASYEEVTNACKRFNEELKNRKIII